MLLPKKSFLIANQYWVDIELLPLSNETHIVFRSNNLEPSIWRYRYSIHAQQDFRILTRQQAQAYFEKRKYERHEANKKAA